MRELLLTRGLIAFVDDADFDALSSWKWSADQTGYARRRSNAEGTVLMHRVITDCPNGLYVDHIDRNRANNQRRNLRICSPSQNQFNRKLARHNTTGFVGVCFHPRSRKYHASIRAFGRVHSLGYFERPEDAARARDYKAIELHGEFARLNFPSWGAA